ncbi:bifunctional UDP-N-acetylmuramoyl-tripeptide:D-alanyl-D-alanine ligase/alanine racemase [Chryseobacterium sp. 6424]|uniref:bifunctional UDP-N-acetylmuramoyl-tripeptide:D-alanyl-D-alanine ligase/alanine racemase n=1 Tax=Chryseobacterium sp. 6424 TaxID=2039166 RepID=UPI000EFD5CFE|nr:bifunctional UDP-N-acetylmuramoyl-tripeptide:D-alanyl-D-alanine ligase/alanine racemase [Chryseobacterium sp. 6424]AYO58760.1 bifunctional UDP-N-acetylmuramoyl-tripeptide:D-alanyl-D-alanine ligase/alanine racemase [Chryseobacterium sp. 6424]
MNYTAQQIAALTDAQLVGNGELIVKSIAFDSRIIFSSKNTAFLAINTKKNSGEKYIPEVIEKGIEIIISETKTSDDEGITWILVNDTVRFLQTLAKIHIDSFNIKTIGITGSNGKTIVKEWLYQSLSDEYTIVKSPKSFNSRIGLPISLLQANEKHEMGIFEVGISHPGEMRLLADIFQPQIGIFTHIGSAHESHFKDQQEIINEKIMLFERSEVIIFNGDNPLVYKSIRDLYSSKGLISYGFENHNDVFIKNASHDGNLVISCFNEEFELKAQQRDDATLYNVLCVITTLKKLGFSTAKIIEKINALKAVEMRLESVNGVRNNLIINDSYNLDLDSLKISYQFIQEYNKPDKNLIITDFMDGKNQEQLYQQVSELTNQQKFNRTFLIGTEITKYKNLFDGKVYIFSDVKELIDSHLLNQIENEIILLKGARKFGTDRLKGYLELQKHDTVLEVNLNAIIHNINIHKSLLKPSTKMMAMVKAYSYGLGGYEIAEFLQHHHIDYLGVAYADEGVALRKNGISVPVMVMNPEQHSYESIIDYQLEPEIYSFRVLNLFYEQLVKKGVEKDYPIHIKLETGMHRLGFKTHELPELVQYLEKMELKVASIFSHLSCADDPSENAYTLEQIKIFNDNASYLCQEIGYVPICHILNSAGITYFSDHQFDMVRIGIGMMGLSTDIEIKKQLRPVVRFKTVISQISEVKRNESVSYNRRYKPQQDTRIATLPVGYADGIPRFIGNKVGKVGINGKLYPIVGTICMDMMMVEIGEDNINEGDEVVIFNSNPSLEDFSAYCNTIPYEVLTSISRRVKRVYIKD